MLLLAVVSSKYYITAPIVIDQAVLPFVESCSADDCENLSIRTSPKMWYLDILGVRKWVSIMATRRISSNSHSTTGFGGPLRASTKVLIFGIIISLLWHPHITLSEP